MEPKLRIVVTLPLHELWDDRGTLPHRRHRWLSADDIRTNLSDGPIQFVIADVGQPLKWIAPADSFRLWRQVAAVIAPPTEAVNQDDYPGGSFYFASLWESESATRLILLERHH